MQSFEYYTFISFKLCERSEITGVHKPFETIVVFLGLNGISANRGGLNMDANTLLYFLIVVEIIHILVSLMMLGLVLDVRDENERIYRRK